MATQKPLFDHSRVAGADLSSHQHKFVKVADDGDVELCSAITDVPIGVLQNDPEAGEVCEIMVIGMSKVEAGEALDERDLIGTAADGQAEIVTPGSDTTQFIVGQVVTPAGAAGEVASAMINCASPARGA